MTIFNKVWFRAYQADEGTTFDDGSGPPPPPPTGAILDCWVLFPSATFVPPSNWDPTIMWVGVGIDAATAINGQIQGIFPQWGGAHAYWHWVPLFGNDEPADEILPDTWYHTVMSVDVTDPIGGLFDYTFSVDGVELMNETGVAGSVMGNISQIGVGADGTGANVDGYLFIDDVTYNSVLVDDFESGTFAAWDDQTGDVTVDSGTFHGGAKSLKANQEPAAFIVKAV